MRKKKSDRTNIIARVTVPATTTSKKSFKHFLTDESHSSVTPVDVHIPTSISGSTKRVYDKILNSHTALGSKYKGSPFSIQKHRENGIKSELRERKETPDTMKMYNQAHIKNNFPHQSIDDIKMMNKKIKLVKKNKTIEDMLLNYTPKFNYFSAKNAERLNSGKLCRKYNLNVTGSKRSVGSNSKSRSSVKGAKEFSKLITKSKLRLSGHISKPDSSTSKYTTKASDLKIQKLEEANMHLINENEYLHKENQQLKKKLNTYMNMDIEHLLNHHPILAESVEEMELMFSQVSQSLVHERQICRRVYEEYMLLIREKEKENINAEMNKNYLETKNSLLKEVLTKRNKDMGEVEKGNKQLMSILEKYDEKMDKLREQIEVQRLKIEKYEEMDSGKIKKIDIDTIDGRINFLVDILEDYKRQLEEMEDEEEEDEDEESSPRKGIDALDDFEKEDPELSKLRDILGAKEKSSPPISEPEIPLDDSNGIL